MIQRTPRPTPFPYTTLFRSQCDPMAAQRVEGHDYGQQTGGPADPLTHVAVSDAPPAQVVGPPGHEPVRDRKSTRLNSSHVRISYAVFCLKKKKNLIDRLKTL